MNQFDFRQLAQNIDTSNLMGCDCSFANIFLYQKKYNTTLQIHDNILFRYNQKDDGTTTFYFPIPLKSQNKESSSRDSSADSSNFLKTALGFIINNFEKPAFHLIPEAQKNQIDSCLKEFFPEHHVSWTECRDDADYLYLQSQMSELPGPVLQKKRNHINRFLRTYENRWSFNIFSAEPDKPVSSDDEKILKDILFVEEQWLLEKQNPENQANPDLQTELDIIKNALNNAAFLKLKGGVLYVDQKPVAMTLASPICDSVIDIHFEKALAEPAKNGAYAMINNQFAKTCNAFTYLNREEDLGIEGLRKAKLSYQPAVLLNKFFGPLN